MISQAHLRILEVEFERVSTAYAALEVAPDPDAASEEWGRFLTHHQQFYNKLKAAIRRDKSDVASQEWLKGVLARQDNEPVLKYALEARNADQHQVEEIVVAERSQRLGLPGGRGTHIDFIGVRGDDGIVEIHGRMPLTCIPVQQFDLISHNELRLLPVLLRDGTSLPVPTTVFGSIPVDSGNMMQIAFLLRALLGEVLNEARRFARK